MSAPDRPVSASGADAAHSASMEDDDELMDAAYRHAAARFTFVDWLNVAIVAGALGACGWTWVTGG